MLSFTASAEGAAASACLSACVWLGHSSHAPGSVKAALAAAGFAVAVVSAGALHPLLTLAALASPPTYPVGLAAAAALALLLPASDALGPSHAALLAAAAATAAGFWAGARGWAEPIARPGLAAPGLITLALGGLGAAVCAWQASGVMGVRSTLP